METKLNCKCSPKFEYNLGAKLFTSRWALEHSMDSHTLLYAPDWPGMPILVSSDIKQIYDKFSDGAVVSEVLSSLQEGNGKGFLDWLSIVNELVDRGFLRDALDPEHFTPKRYQPSMKGMNIWIHLNNNCNLACSYCFVEHTPLQMKENTIDTTVSLIGKTVRKHRVKDVLVKFAGGEPTLSLPQMEYFYEKLTDELEDTDVYLHWTVLTNGTNVNERFLKFIDKAKVKISISVDGYGKYHDLYRVYRGNSKANGNKKNKGSWTVINQNIEVLRKHGITPYINAMVGPKTSKGLPDLAKWMFSNGLIGTIHVVRNVDDSWEKGDHRKAQYSAYCDQLIEDFEKMFHELENKSFRINLPQWMQVAELYFDQPAPDICCGIGSDHIVIKYDGTIASCPMTTHEKTVAAYDDLFLSAKETFKESTNDKRSGNCLSCQWFKVCASACPVANQRIRGHAFAQSPLCKFWKYVIPRYVFFYGKKLLQAKEGNLIGK